MNHYQKIATVVIRCAAAVGFALGTMGIFYWAIAALLAGLDAEDYKAIASNLMYMFFGIVLFFVGRPLGRLVGRGME